MHFTVKDCLEASYMKKAKLIAGEKGLHRHASKITVLDSPDGIKFIRGREIVLTSTYAIYQLNDKSRILSDLNNAGASCMVFKNKFIAGITNDMLETANRLNFPLIEISKNITWAEIIDAFYNHLFSYQYDVINYTEKVHTTFTNLVLADKSVVDICNKLIELIDKPVAIIDDFNEIIFISYQVKNQFDLSNFLCNVKPMLRTIKKQGYCYIDHGNHRIYVRLIDSGLNTFMYFLVFLKPEYDLEVLQLKAVDYAATVMTLELFKQRQVEETEMRLYGNFLSNLIFRAHRQDSRNLLRKAKFMLRYKEDQEFKIIVINTDNFSFYIEKEKPSEELVQQTKINIERSIKNYFSKIHKMVYISTEDDSYIIFYPETDSNLHDTLRSLKRSINDHIPHFTYSIGVSQAHNKIDEIKKAFEEASSALSIGRKIWGKNKIYFYDNLGLYIFLAQSSTDNEMMLNHIKAKFGKLLEIDNMKEGIYLKTLDTYFKENMNINKTAKTMYLHPKTIKYRLDKIAGLTGANLQKQEDRLLLELITKIVPISGNLFIDE